MSKYPDYCASLSPDVADKLCDNENVFSFPLKGTVQVGGDGIWGGKAANAKVTEITFKVTMYTLVELPSLYIDVEHNQPWDIYTDDTFVRTLKKLIKDKLDLNIKSLDFTEQGMQDNRCASMECDYDDTLKVLNWLKGQGKFNAAFTAWLDAYNECYNEVKKLSGVKRIKDAYQRGYRIQDGVVKRLGKHMKHLDD